MLKELGEEGVGEGTMQCEEDCLDGEHVYNAEANLCEENVWGDGDLGGDDGDGDGDLIASTIWILRFFIGTMAGVSLNRRPSTIDCIKNIYWYFLIHEGIIYIDIAWKTF